MRCAIDRIGMLLLDVMVRSMVKGCSIHLVGMLVIGCPIDHGGY
jgi:hypothetical protein